MITLVALLATAQAADVGVAPATRKILPTTPTPTAQAASLQAARGEWEAFQVVVRDPAGLVGIDLELSDLVGPGGAVIPASAATLYREHYLHIERPSSAGVTLHEREAGDYPDPLIPFEDPWAPGVPVGAPFDLQPDQTGAIFVDLRVPADASWGSYAGTATLTAAGLDPVELPVSLEVWDFELPAQRTVATAYGFSYKSMKRYHGGPSGDDQAFLDQVVHRYTEALHDHRLDPTWLQGSVDFEFDESGELLPIDWAEYDAAVGPWLDGSRFGDGVGITRFNVGHFIPGRGTGELSDDQYVAAAEAFARHLDDRGWWDRAWVYAIDEPWLNGGATTYHQIHDDVALLTRDSDLWEGRTLVTSPYNEAIDGDVGIWCPLQTMYDEWFLPGGTYEGREFYADRRDLGEELWFYVCNGTFPPHPGYDIDTAIGYEPRIVKWGAWYEGATGFLYWSTTYWVEDDPWNVFANPDQFGDFMARNGDGFLLYPGDHDGTAGGKGSPEGVAIDGPIVSFRMKQVRDGLEDWELFWLAEDLGGGDYARAQVSRAYDRFGAPPVEDCSVDTLYCPDDQPWTLDEQVLYEVRANVAAKVLFLLDPDQWPDPEASGDTGEDGDEEGCGCATGATAGGVVLVPVLALHRRRRHRRR